MGRAMPVRFPWGKDPRSQSWKYPRSYRAPWPWSSRVQVPAAPAEEWASPMLEQGWVGGAAGPQAGSTWKYTRISPLDSRMMNGLYRSDPKYPGAVEGQPLDPGRGQAMMNGDGSGHRRRRRGAPLSGLRAAPPGPEWLL